MAKILFSLIAALMLAVVSYAGSETITTEGRSSSGKLLFKSKTKGNETEVRSPSGKLLMKSKTKGDVTEVRTPSGKLLQRIKEK